VQHNCHAGLENCLTVQIIIILRVDLLATRLHCFTSRQDHAHPVDGNPVTAVQCVVSSDTSVANASTLQQLLQQHSTAQHSRSPAVSTERAQSPHRALLLNAHASVHAAIPATLPIALPDVGMQGRDDESS
jgi:hypothetical protein